MKKITVAVDGPAGSGKSSVCRRAALETGLSYVDSGAIYRAVTWSVLRRHPHAHPEIAYGEEISGLEIDQEFLADGTARTTVNGIDVTALVRDEAIARNIGPVSDSREVRDFVNALLRGWSKSRSLIMDGRDIGTVVFPDARLKIYLDASVDVRAARRVKEYREMGKNVDENLVRNQIIQRDRQDMGRTYGALQRADDAVYIDTSQMEMPAVIAHITQMILAAMN